MRKQLRLSLHKLSVSKEKVPTRKGEPPFNQKVNRAFSKPFPPHPLTQRDKALFLWVQGFSSGYKVESTLSWVCYFHSAFQGNWQRALKPIVLVAFDFTTKCRTKTTWEKKSSFVHSFIVHPTVSSSDPSWPKGWDLVYYTGLWPERINLPRLGTKHSPQDKDEFVPELFKIYFVLYEGV